MLQHANSKCIYVKFLQKRVLKTRRNYSDDITYKNGMFKFKQGNRNGSHRKFHQNSHFQLHTTLPSQSQIIIAGAGTVANSVAYHLVVNGWNDVLVLEQNRYITYSFTLKSLIKIKTMQNEFLVFKDFPSFYKTFIICYIIYFPSLK